jgi:hypothetical protein
MQEMDALSADLALQAILGERSYPQSIGLLLEKSTDWSIDRPTIVDSSRGAPRSVLSVPLCPN